jgi:hypothetical protein
MFEKLVITQTQKEYGSSRPSRIDAMLFEQSFKRRIGSLNQLTPPALLSVPKTEFIPNHPCHYFNKLMVGRLVFLYSGVWT